VNYSELALAAVLAGKEATSRRHISVGEEAGKEATSRHHVSVGEWQPINFRLFGITNNWAHFRASFCNDGATHTLGSAPTYIYIYI